jgi:hypothetical protein
MTAIGKKAWEAEKEQGKRKTKKGPITAAIALRSRICPKKRPIHSFWNHLV